MTPKLPPNEKPDVKIQVRSSEKIIKVMETHTPMGNIKKSYRKPKRVEH